ncbi:hypothetical protein I6F35_02825 [Bradyrhizobium sp. BRP22]|uniref:hypothetical protein n=1 Tax=Bradyrhizobium sp. BRP22 TaxID=2793821 RepID=UPI001CD23B11|nr:hypothetical protein [Bradyrhizobium sp. BRP22]MCA1452148.1 hypothetical protein [Bradyrhizobium sp. BRP22]
MRTLVFAVAVAAFGFLTTEASAVTVIKTTPADVKAQCGGKTTCTTACGSTICSYNCSKPKKQCTAAIFLQRPPEPRRPRPIPGTSGRMQ